MQTKEGKVLQFTPKAVGKDELFNLLCDCGNTLFQILSDNRAICPLCEAEYTKPFSFDKDEEE